MHFFHCNVLHLGAILQSVPEAFIFGPCHLGLAPGHVLKIGSGFASPSDRSMPSSLLALALLVLSRGAENDTCELLSLQKEMPVASYQEVIQHPRKSTGRDQVRLL